MKPDSALQLWCGGFI